MKWTKGLRDTFVYRSLKFILAILGRSEYPLPFSKTEPAEPYLERAIHHVGKSPDPSRFDEQFYTYFSEIYGPEQILQRQYAIYIEYIPKGKNQPFLDVGCGAGEFIAFLDEHGVKAHGIDSNPNEVERAKCKGLDVQEADALTFLKTFNSYFSGISMFEVIEHIPPESLPDLISAIYHAIIPGGVVLLETINAKNPLAFHVFYTDPTHTRPVPSDFLVFLLQWVGFANIQIIYSLPNSVTYEQSRDSSRAYFDYALIASKPRFV